MKTLTILHDNTLLNFMVLDGESAETELVRGTAGDVMIWLCGYLHNADRSCFNSVSYCSELASHSTFNTLHSNERQSQ